MREIKFQIYWIAGHEMLYDTNNDLEFRDKENYWITDLSDARNHPERYKVRQYTGLKDKNGVEIYEGDILEFEDTGEEGYEYLEGYDFTNRATVCYENGRFELENFVGGDGYVLESMSNECHEDFMIILNNSKIIGNRYENPELLQ